MLAPKPASPTSLSVFIPRARPAAPGVESCAMSSTFLLFDQFRRPLEPDLPLRHHLANHPFDLIRRSAGRNGELPGVQDHMPALDPLGGQGPQSGQFLSQPPGPPAPAPRPR